MKRILTLLMLFSWVLPFCAQENSREKSAKGSYTYEIPKSMSYEQASSRHRMMPLPRLSACQ